MLERSKGILRLACFALVALVIYQVADVAIRINPLARVKIPELPSLPPDTNAPVAGRTNAVTNVVSAAGGTNNQTSRVGTNMAVPAIAAATNLISPMAATNAGTQPAQPTNLTAGGTNLVALRAAGLTNTNAAVLAGVQTGTNAMPSAGTNAISSATNAAGGAAGARAQLMAGGPNAGPRQAGGPRGIDLPPAIQARVDRVAESEILGAIIRPPPLALLGIAGNYAFLRTPSGQSGMVKVGDELGGIKLVATGTNRVLVEDQGQQKELTIYSGFGGESLLPKQETPK